LSKYRSYTPCPVCSGARLKLKACCGASAARKTPTRCCRPAKRFMPTGVKWSREQLEALPGLCLHDLMLMPIDRLRRFFDRIGTHGKQPE
jgi:excinuclease ABC subunit A